MQRLGSTATILALFALLRFPALHAGALPEQTITALEYFPRWETPLDQEAHKTYIRLTHDCHDFASLQKAAPIGSEDRRLMLRFFDSFEDAGQLIRAGHMNESIFLDSWYDVGRTWKKTRVYIVGFRAEAGNPHLYEAFEWLASRSDAYWAAQEKNPPQWHPLDYPEPTDADRAVFATFDRVTPRHAAGWKLLEELQKNGPTFTDFHRMIPDGDPKYSDFDWLICDYERAGIYMKNGIIHPKLLFSSWRSPSEVWAIVGPWIKGLREEKKRPSLYDSMDGLVDFEQKWRASHPEFTAKPPSN